MDWTEMLMTSNEFKTERYQRKLNIILWYHQTLFSLTSWKGQIKIQPLYIIFCQKNNSIDAKNLSIYLSGSILVV